MDEDRFWDKYRKDLKDGYYKLIDDKPSMKSEFIVEYPEEIARRLKNYRKNKLSQIWKFYDHTMRVQDRLQRKGDPLEILKAELCELQPAVNYAKGRDVVTQEFKDFIDLNVQCIHDNEDLRAFIKHFQSVIAYLPRQNQR